ncbi:hypothetical protein AX016_1150 [Cellulophaga sp. RHA19]|uniref:hypothetical protein n=1 Tax=Cellulophaga sp. RHA19 TaxID=1798237 RepID=UPI000C2BA73D|nr:hypothetical protein [Cellulophaga sp. RHA19]PKB42970.1 hypothetical protein AX016_1150 [Cellulophaga sp. RHA19]
MKKSRPKTLLYFEIIAMLILCYLSYAKIIEEWQFYFMVTGYMIIAYLHWFFVVSKNKKEED